MPQSPAVVIDQANLGGLADSIYSGGKGSLAAIVGLDIHSVPGLMLVNQKMALDSPAVGVTNEINDLVTPVAASDGNMYFFGKTTGKVWKKDLTTGTYTYVGQITAHDAQGYNNPTAGVDLTSVGTVVWTAPTQAEKEDSSYATAAGLTTTVQSHYLKMTGFGFNIPTGVTILGVQAKIKAKANLSGGSGSEYIKVASCKITSGGSLVGTDLADDQRVDSVITTILIGDDERELGDAFGIGSLTPANINDTTFGIAISFLGRTVTATTVSVEVVELRVFYAPTSPQILDAREYYGYMYYAQAGHYVGYWKVGDAFSNRSDTNIYLYNGNESYHPMEEQNLILFIGDGNRLCAVDSSDPDDPLAAAIPIVSDGALLLEPQYEICSLGKQATNLLVGSVSPDRINLAGIFNWNTWSPSFTNAYYVNEVGINCFIDAGDGTVIVNAGLNGNIYIYDGNIMRAVKQIPPSFPTLYSPTQTGKVYHRAVANKQGIPLMAFSRTVGNPALQGVYSFGARNIGYPRVLSLEFPLSNGHLNGMTIWAMVVVGNDIYISWKDESVGATQIYGVDKLDWSNKINGAYFETRVMKYSRLLLDNYKKAAVNYNQLPTGTALTMYYNKNHSGYTVFDTSEFVNDVDRNQYLEEIDINAKTLQIKLVFTSSGNTAPSFEDAVLLVE